MAESKKQPAKRPDGGVCIHRSVGLPKSRVFYGKTKAEAERKYQDAVLAYKLECMDPKEKRYTFRAVSVAYEEYIRGPEKPVRRGTVNAYKKHFAPARAYFGDTVMNDIDAQAVGGYLAHLKMEGKSKPSKTQKACCPASSPIGVQTSTVPVILCCWRNCPPG